MRRNPTEDRCIARRAAARVFARQRSSQLAGSPPPAARDRAARAMIWRGVSGPQKPSEQSSTMSSCREAHAFLPLGLRLAGCRPGIAAGGCGAGCVRHRLLADAALVEQPLHHACGRACAPGCARADQVEAAVADVRPVRVAVLHHAGASTVRGESTYPRLCASCRMAACAVSMTRARKSAGSSSRGCASASNAVPAIVDRDLRRDLAVRVPAEAVGDREQRRLRGRPVADAVLVALARQPTRLACTTVRGLFTEQRLLQGEARSAGASGGRGAGTSRSMSRRSAEYLPAQALPAGTTASLLCARFAGCGAAPREAGVHRGADRIDVGPRARARSRWIARTARARRSPACTWAELGRLGRRASGARRRNRCSTRRAVVAQEDVGRLDVQVQQLVGVHFAQPVQQLREDRRSHSLARACPASALDVVLQRAAALVAHHHVARSRSRGRS